VGHDHRVRIRIEGHDLPGRECVGHGEFPGYAGVHVAVQRANRPAELLDPQPADVPSATWILEATVVDRPGGPDVRGPYLQGGPGKRFIYLSWVAIDAEGTPTLFRRAKLFLADVDPNVLTAAISSGELVGRLGLTDAKGNPVCARVAPPAVQWSPG